MIITTLETATNASVGEYQLTLRCTLDDEEGSEEVTTINYTIDPNNNTNSTETETESAVVDINLPTAYSATGDQEDNSESKEDSSSETNFSEISVAFWKEKLLQIQRDQAIEIDIE